jgi:hypothetical protein
MQLFLIFSNDIDKYLEIFDHFKIFVEKIGIKKNELLYLHYQSSSSRVTVIYTVG